MLEVALGASRILARPGDRRLCVLDPAAGALWDLHAAGLEPETIAGWLTRRFGVAEPAARAQVESQFAGWRDAGLFDSAADPPPAAARRVCGPLPPGLVLFPRFQPGTTPHVESLAPEAVLQGVVEAEAVIRDLTQPKLEAIARWVCAMPAYALNYPDLDSGLALVRWILAGCEAGARP
jgi:hypothetical protein